MRLSEKVRSGWESRFPELGGKWTHWKITGDSYLLAVVKGVDLLTALKVVEDNYGRYSSIKAYRATVDEGGQLTDEDESSCEISSFAYDEWLRKSVRSDD